MLEQIIAKNLRYENQEERDNSRFRVSDAGRCHLMRFWKRQGKQFSDVPDERTLRVFEVGHIFHRWLQDLLKDEGVLVEAEREVSDIHRLGYVDAIVKDEKGELILYDFKTVHSRKFHWKRKEGNGDIHYAMQGNTYAMMLPFGVADVRIAYISKDDLCIDEMSVDEIYSGNLNEICLNDWGALVEAWNAKTEPKPNPMSWECKYCSYKSCCPYSLDGMIKSKEDILFKENPAIEAGEPPKPDENSSLIEFCKGGINMRNTPKNIRGRRGVKKEIANTYLKEITPSKVLKTQKNEIRMMNKLVDEFGDKRISEIKRQKIIDYYKLFRKFCLYEN